MFAFRAARNIKDKSCLTASRGKAGIPIPNEKGPASVVPASQAMKFVGCASASSRATALIPPPTLPTGATNRIWPLSDIELSQLRIPTIALTVYSSPEGQNDFTGTLMESFIQIISSVRCDWSQEYCATESP